MRTRMLKGPAIPELQKSTATSTGAIHDIMSRVRAGVIGDECGRPCPIIVRPVSSFRCWRASSIERRSIVSLAR